MAIPVALPKQTWMIAGSTVIAIQRMHAIPIEASTVLSRDIAIAENKWLDDPMTQSPDCLLLHPDELSG